MYDLKQQLFDMMDEQLEMASNAIKQGIPSIQLYVRKHIWHRLLTANLQLLESQIDTIAATVTLDVSENFTKEEIEPRLDKAVDLMIDAYRLVKSEFRKMDPVVFFSSLSFEMTY